jgi:hypothetical protein
MNEETLDSIGRELVAAIEAALAADARVQACLERARTAGIGFRVALHRGGRPAGGSREARNTPEAAPPVGAARAALPAPAVYSVTESDRRFLRSLRIAVDEGN